MELQDTAVTGCLGQSGMLREEGEVGRGGLRVGEQEIGVVEALIEDLEIVEKKKKRSRDKGTGKIYFQREKEDRDSPRSSC